ncbi:hypothetical protein [Saccharothrix sp.]|uniref:hypothetical protein n=1 Tax=Saccharothrix sp. TaxID=1873460 RepID=UPI0028125086|nr:hypothetical protein [Saccharothrix sp.]
MTCSEVQVDAPPALPTVVGVTGDVNSTAVGGSGPHVPSISGAAARSPLPLSPGAAYYAQAFGWPVVMAGDAVAAVCGTRLAAFTMPSGLGGEVNHLLKIHMLNAPVVELLTEAGRTLWVFLCEPRRSASPASSLTIHRVAHHGEGSTVLLPPTVGTTAGSPRWVDQPQFGMKVELPPWMSVFACIRRATLR